MSLRQFSQMREELREIRWTHLRYILKADYHRQLGLLVGWENWAARRASEWGLTYTDFKA